MAARIPEFASTNKNLRTSLTRHAKAINRYQGVKTSCDARAEHPPTHQALLPFQPYRPRPQVAFLAKRELFLTVRFAWMTRHARFAAQSVLLVEIGSRGSDDAGTKRESLMQR